MRSRINKKGQLLGQLTRVILFSIVAASVLFGCANAFELVNRQAQNNYLEVVGEIEELDRQGDLLAESGKKDFALPKTKFAILDDETALVYYERGGDVNINVDVAADANTLSDYRIVIENPGSKERSLCLIEDYKSESEALSSVVTITPTDMFCEDVPIALQPGLANCGFGTPVNVESYSCSNGFFIDRGILEDADFVQAYYQNGRSVNLFMVWQNDVIKIYDGEKQTPTLKKEDSNNLVS